MKWISVQKIIPETHSIDAKNKSKKYLKAQGTAYLGTNANQPPNWTFSNRAPNQYDTQYDTQNVSIGDMWLDQSTGNSYILVSLQENPSSKEQLADWVIFTSLSDIEGEESEKGIQ